MVHLSCWLKAPSLEPVTWWGYHHKNNTMRSTKHYDTKSLRNWRTNTSPQKSCLIFLVPWPGWNTIRINEKTPGIVWLDCSAIYHNNNRIKDNMYQQYKGSDYISGWYDGNNQQDLILSESRGAIKFLGSWNGHSQKELLTRLKRNPKWWVNLPFDLPHKV